MELKVVELEKGFTPKKATIDACASDCFAREISFEEGKGFIQIKLGFKIEIPKGYVGKLYPRSSVTNRGLFLGNSVGIIDSDFRGEVMARFYINGFSLISMQESYKKKGDSSYKDILNQALNGYKVGEACAQIRIEKNEEYEFIKTEELSSTERGDEGFGTTNQTTKK